MNTAILCKEIQNESRDKHSNDNIKIKFPANDNYEYFNWKNIIRLRHLHEPFPEKKLWKVVICQAIEDAIIKSNRGKKAKRLAISWFTDENEDFKTVCVLAGYPHEVVKENALRIIANEMKKFKEK